MAVLNALVWCLLERDGFPVQVNEHNNGKVRNNTRPYLTVDKMSESESFRTPGVKRKLHRTKQEA